MVLKGHRDVVVLPLEHMDLSEIATKDDKGQMALHRMAWNGHMDIVTLLLEKMDLGQIAVKDES